MVATIEMPDLTTRPLKATVERTMKASPEALFRAWTREFDRWFADPGTVLMEGKVNTPFFFIAVGDGQRYPHYGRFLRLEPGRLVELAWMTGKDGTDGAETVVTVELAPSGGGTSLRLTHAGFYDERARDAHQEGWKQVLAQLDEKTTG